MVRRTVVGAQQATTTSNPVRLAGIVRRLSGQTNAMSDTDRIAIHDAAGTAQVFWGKHRIARTTAARVLTETGYPERLYIPMDAVATDVLVVSETMTHCPYKGDATYYHVHIDGEQLDDAAWCYARPIDAVAAIAGHLAFDHHALTIERPD